MSGKEPKGEGSYEGARQYDKAAREFVRTHDVGKLGKDAKQAVASDDGTLKQAEAAGRKPARG